MDATNLHDLPKDMLIKLITTIQDRKIKIYVVHHCTFENTNVFFTKLETAQAKLKELAKENDREMDEWCISIINEGELFQACLDDLE